MVTFDQVVAAVRDMLKRSTFPGFTGIVKEAKPGDYTAEVDAGNGTDWTADLIAAEQEDGFILVPKVGSQVTLLPIGRDGQRCAMVQSSALQEVRFKMGAIKMRMHGDTVTWDAPKTKFNGGLLGGLVKVFRLTGKINMLEKQCNALQTSLIELQGKYNSHLPIAHPEISEDKRPTYLATPFALPLLSLTAIPELSNDDILQ